jgi:hypothetical protein
VGCGLVALTWDIKTSFLLNWLNQMAAIFVAAFNHEVGYFVSGGYKIVKRSI